MLLCEKPHAARYRSILFLQAPSVRAASLNATPWRDKSPGSWLYTSTVTFRNPQSWRSLATFSGGVSSTTSRGLIHGGLFVLCTPRWEQQNSSSHPGTGVSVNLVKGSNSTQWCSLGRKCKTVMARRALHCDVGSEENRSSHTFSVKASN